MPLTFVYDRKKRAAVDMERGISICEAIGLWSDSDPPVFRFNYSDSEFSFDFGAISHLEDRSYIRRGKQVKGSLCVSIEIFEPSISGGIQFSQRRPSSPLTPVRLEEIKNDLQEGMYALCIPRSLDDGVPLVSGFNVSFIDRLPKKKT